MANDLELTSSPDWNPVALRVALATLRTLSEIADLALFESRTIGIQSGTSKALGMAITAAEELLREPYLQEFLPPQTGNE